MSKHQRGGGRLLVAGVVLVLVLSLGASVGEAKPTAKRDQTTLTVLLESPVQTTWNALVANFQRVYPNISFQVSWVPSNTQMYSELTTELSAGNGPDLLWTTAGNGTPISVTPLGKDGYLLPLVKQPWLKRTAPLVTSLDKVGKTLYAFTPGVGFYGLMVNNTLFAQLGLKVPTTFGQLLETCKQASAKGTAPFLLPGSSGSPVSTLIMQLATTTEYAQDPNFNSEMEDGKVTFAGSAGWQEALQEFIDMNSAGCFPAGSAGNNTTNVYNQFANGQGLMFSANSPLISTIHSLNPSLDFSFVPFPNGRTVADDRTMEYGATSFAINAKSSQTSAAETFIDFFARPDQNRFWANTQGLMSQYDYQKGIVPSTLSAFATQIKGNKAIVAPVIKWWNPNVSTAINTDAIGLVTGQQTISQVLAAMDTAWAQGSD